VSQGPLAVAADDAIAVYADNPGGVLLSHDEGFAHRRQRNTIGQHVWLHCDEPDAAAILTKHLPEIVNALEHMPDVVIEVRPDSVRIHPGAWT
jgi:hypothetical protein